MDTAADTTVFGAVECDAGLLMHLNWNKDGREIKSKGYIIVYWGAILTPLSQLHFMWWESVGLCHPKRRLHPHAKNTSHAYTTYTNLWKTMVGYTHGLMLLLLSHCHSQALKGYLSPKSVASIFSLRRSTEQFQ